MLWLPKAAAKEGFLLLVFSMLFLLSNFDPFHTFYGTSAGAMNLCAFLCRQNGIGRSFILDLTTDSEFFNLFHYIRRKQYLGLDWALDKICDYPYRLDVDLGRKGPC